MENVYRIGTPTGGALSDALEKELPNGWHFTISNEQYTDTQGKLYESTGIPPDYLLDYPEDRQAFFRQMAADPKGDRARVLEAIAALQDQSSAGKQAGLR